MSIKLNDEIREDFWDFWDFWEELMEYAKSIAAPDRDGKPVENLGLPNKIMVSAYAAGVWFSRGILAKGGSKGRGRAKK